MPEITVENILTQVAQLPPSERARLRHLLEQQELQQKSPKPPLDQRVPAKPMPEGSYRALRWVVEHAREYAGQWVALDGDHLIAHSPKHDEVWAAVQASSVHLPLVTFVEDPDKTHIGF